MQKIHLMSQPIVSDVAARGKERLESTLTFDLVMALLSFWFIGGSYLDGWAHVHIPSLETFFTPWHGVLYSGYFVSAAFLLGTVLVNILRGYAPLQAVPVGYDLSVLGAFLFAIGGVGDLIWHTLFGIEANIDALLSPTHLILAISGALIATGPLRAAWARASHPLERNTFRSLFPAVISLTLLYSIITFFTSYASPFSETLLGFNRYPASISQRNTYQALGVTGFLLQAVILTGVLLFAMRRWRLPFGSITLLVALNSAGMALFHDGRFSTGTAPVIAVGILGGLLADIFYQALIRRQAPDCAPWLLPPSTYRWFAFGMPIILYTLYDLAVFAFGGGTWWSVHMWAGTIFLTGIAGLLVGFALFPPAVPQENMG